MEILPFLTTAFIQGLIGSIHCIGMCGPFIHILNHRSDKVILNNTIYNLSRTLSYAIIGFILGTLGRGLNFFFLNGFATYFGGAIIIIWGLSVLLSLKFNSGIENIASKFVKFLFKPIQSISNSYIYSSLLGFVSGLLPCGLLYSGFAISFMAGTPIYGSLVMISFSLGTYPMVFGIGLMSKTIWKKLQGTNWKYVISILMILIGIGLIYYRHKLNLESENCKS